MNLVFNKYKLIKESSIAKIAGVENGFIPIFTNSGYMIVKSILLNKPPKAGPKIKPKANAIPINAIPLDLVLALVISAITAVAVEILPPMIPPINLAAISRVNDAENIQRR